MINLKNINQVAEKIKIPFDEWEGNCYAIACALVHKGVVKGTPRYGHFLGEIHPESIFYVKSGIGFVQHGWVEMKDKSIIDPTRFSFEGRKPYIYIGKNDYYDVGGNSFRDAMRQSTPVPTYQKNERQIELNLSKPVLRILHNILKEERTSNVFSISQLFWIANANPIEFGKHAKAVYSELGRKKESALVPQDNWQLIME